MRKKTQKQKDEAPAPYVSTPLRHSFSDSSPFANLFKSIASRLPSLQRNLDMAEMDAHAPEFVKKSLISALFFTIVLEAIILWAAISAGTSALLLIGAALLTTVVIFLTMFNMGINQPKLKIIRRGKEIDKEIVFCGRHLLIELRSGVTLFDAMLGVSEDYGEVSKEFNKIVEKITLGVPSSVALHDVASQSPSSYFKRVVLQIANSIASGSDIGDSLEAVLNQVAKEQIIQLKEYGQKLNPLVMFYMLFGIIIPSIGVAFMIIVFSVVGAGFEAIGTTLIAGVFALVAIMQFLFLTVAENARPNFDL